MKNKDLDNFFKSRSNSFDEMPSDDLWQKIQNNVAPKPNFKSNFKRPFFTMALPIIALISIVSLYVYDNNSIKPNNTISRNNSIKKEKSVVVSDALTPIKSIVSTLDLKKSTATNKVVNKKTKTIPASKNEIQAIEKNDFEDKIYTMEEVNQKPEFPGSINKLYEFINKKYITPKECPGGRITITFVIEKDGSLTDIKTIKDIGFNTGTEAIRVLKESPKWKPGKQDGKAVRVQYTLPMTIQDTRTSGDNLVYSVVGINVRPEYIGGNEKLLNFIKQSYRIPKDCPDGIVYLTFIIEKDGSLTDIKVAKDIGYGSGEEAIRVLKECPKWEPGEQNGKKVRVKYTLPISVHRGPVLIDFAEKNEDNSVHSLTGIEVKPEFIGGKEKLYEYIKQNYNVPEKCRDGRIYLTFIIEKNGSLTDIKAIRDLSFGSGEEAIRVLKECPNWQSGQQNGKKARVLYSMPIIIKEHQISIK